ncbi:hypothetical protein ABEB36_010274 [Hypothenemus hampei]|uniref:Myb-like, SWIRM and MPN domain-containing protein 1 n=1 Tax=Hypothenemus hampei TaxID=57062 RepID=A0ABD1EL73_HYPHA
MADEDEVDILGDFNLSLENEANLVDKALLVSQNSDLLNCDYTIHPQWLLDKPSTNPDNWYNENLATTILDGGSDSDVMAHTFTENCITDESGWTDKEKNLLQKGLEIFGKSSLRLSQFIGSKTASEVRYYLRNFYTENLSHYRVPDILSGDNLMGSSFLNSDLLNSDQIPASIEEVIASVDTDYETDCPPITSKKYPNSPNGKFKNETKKKSPGKSIIKRSQKGKLKYDENKQFKVKKDIVKKNVFETNQHLDISSTRQITTGKGLMVPLCKGEEIVTIKKVEDDSSDIDIEHDVDSDCKNVKKKHNDNHVDVKETTVTEDVASNLKCNMQKFNENVAKELNSLEEPSAELILDKNVITDLEKVVNFEFFEGRGAKTPERYMKIRNHIINSWLAAKPNYVYKTAMRLGLKDCGDVTFISKIHYFLEQIGAINFGCEQTKYERPLINMLQMTQTIKCKVKPQKSLLSREPSELGPRQRIKRRFNNDGEGGYTMVHGEQGQIIDTRIVNEEPIKPRLYIKKPTIRLIYCRAFPPDRPQQFVVKITLSTLILMDFHAHSYHTEVMGLVGGHWDYEDGCIKITSYEPCKNVASSTTHCDMCPISQAKAADSIHSKNLEIIGWFHSHPTFAPEPSQQDLDTQLCVQQWIGHGKQCIGVILSPFSVNAALISSPFRCWMVDKKENYEDQLVPYRFKVDITSEDFCLREFLSSMKALLVADIDNDQKDKKIPFHGPYFQDSSLTHLDKFVSSVNMHLAKNGTLPKTKCFEIVQGIRDLIQNSRQL